MKPIIIDDKHRDKLLSALDEVQKHSKVRTVTVDDILGIPGRIRKKYPITIKAMDGCTFAIDINNQTFPNAYFSKAKSRPQSTNVTVTVKGGKFYITNICRDYTYSQTYNVVADLTDTAKAALLHSLKYYTI